MNASWINLIPFSLSICLCKEMQIHLWNFSTHFQHTLLTKVMHPSHFILVSVLYAVLNILYVLKTFVIIEIYRDARAEQIFVIDLQLDHKINLTLKLIKLNVSEIIDLYVYFCYIYDANFIRLHLEL